MFATDVAHWSSPDPLTKWRPWAFTDSCEAAGRSRDHSPAGSQRPLSFRESQKQADDLEHQDQIAQGSGWEKYRENPERAPTTASFFPKHALSAICAC